ncbi:MAG: tetratricopeptide repeat protein [Holosporales bacterium]|jgi:hypothetical protein|nr:tetratricopeptide repeat protein [Holosporales bacterium]
MDDDQKKEGRSPKVVKLNVGCCNSNDRASDIFVESIQEEIRQENWKNLWDKYGKIITIAVVGSLIVTGVYNMWQKKDLEEREAISVKFSNVQGMVMSGETEKVIDQIKELTNVNKANYALLAKFEYAASLLNSKNKEALSVYKSIFENKKADDLFKDLAYILYVNASIDLMDPKQLLSNMDNMIKILSGEKFVKGKWSLMAQESLAFCYLKIGKNDLARATLEKLVKTSDIPNGMLERSRIIIQSLKE